jgi:CheY-like chemotaxis protein
MREIINWLVEVEEMASDLYKGAAFLFRADDKFSSFLNQLADDEASHAGILMNAGKYLQKEDDRFIVFDRATREKIDSPFDETYALLLAGVLTRDALIECIIDAEFSELNHVFLYIVSRMKSDKKELINISTSMREHILQIERFLESLPDGQRYIDRIRRLPEIHKKILIVEDYAPGAELLAGLLEKEGSIEIASNGKEALNKMSGRHFDIIISDIGMPEMDGIEFCKEVIKADPGASKRIILYTSSYADDYRDFFNEYKLRYMQKPADITDMLKAVREILHTPE